MNKIVAKHSVENASDNEPETSFPKKSNDDCNDHKETALVVFSHLLYIFAEVKVPDMDYFMHLQVASLR